MARHTSSGSRRCALLRVGLAVTAAGAALAAGGGAAQAAGAPPEGSGAAATGRALAEGLGHAAAGGAAPVKTLPLNPMAGTGVDPLDNSVGTRVADFEPVGTAAVTAPLTRGDALQDLPAAGPATDLLPG
ncbi:hypothetical protein [Streptomyces sp. Wb2n-11]|uniref:hypothetical protein n=1 Tax=Streptomyces sp. Wb2n-11 TaxID=1030533 RepID=UPI000AED59D3|nr:hypothetical protein [Streptomyces sp. Wb2n-11]